MLPLAMLRLPSERKPLRRLGVDWLSYTRMNIWPITGGQALHDFAALHRMWQRKVERTLRATSEASFGQSRCFPFTCRVDGRSSPYTRRSPVIIGRQWGERRQLARRVVRDDYEWRERFDRPEPDTGPSHSATPRHRDSAARRPRREAAVEATFGRTRRARICAAEVRLSRDSTAAGCTIT